MVKKLIFLTLVLAFCASAQVSTSLVTRSVKFLDGSLPAAYIYTSPNDTAKDSTVYIKRFQYDLGGRPVFYGLNEVVKSDTFSLKLALDGSPDSTTWYAVDSVTVTPQITGQYIKNIDLSLIRYPYWRLRYSTATTALRGNATPTGQFNFFVVTNLRERF